MATTIDSQAELGQIREIAEPHMWISAMTDRDWFGQYDLEGNLKPTPSIGPDTPAWQVRRRLLDQADQLVAALGAEGWQVMDGLYLTLKTEVRNFRQSLAGELMVLSEQMGTTATISLRVGRAR